MLRKKKLFVRPKKAFESVRIKEENELLKKYGLKSKREIWKALARVNYFRRRAKELAKSSREEQELFFSKLKAIGLKTKFIADVLNLKVEDILERRLPTLIAKKGLASTPQQARQFVVHKKVIVGGNVINIPSYIVPVSLENSIKIKHANKTEKIQVQDKKTQEIKNAE